MSLQGADQGDTTTIHQTLAEPGEAVAELIEHETAQAPQEEPKVNLGGAITNQTKMSKSLGDPSVSTATRLVQRVMGSVWHLFLLPQSTSSFARVDGLPIRHRPGIRLYSPIRHPGSHAHPLQGKSADWQS